MTATAETAIIIQPDVRAALRRYGYEDAGRIAAMVDALLREALGMRGALNQQEDMNHEQTRTERNRLV